MSKPTDARSSAMASPDGKPVATKNQDGLGSIFECKWLLSLALISTFSCAVFETLVYDVKKNFADRNEGNDPMINNLESNIK